jgi:signal transduction histidine kinase
VDPSVRLPRLPSTWRGYGFGLVGVAVVTAVISQLLRWPELFTSNPILYPYLIAVLATAAIYGRGPAMATALVAFVVYDFFFVAPLYTPTLTNWHPWVAVLIFLVTALVTGHLAAALRQRAEDARRREQEAAALYEVVRLVAASALELRPLLGLILDQLQTIVSYRSAEIVAIEEDDILVLDYRGPLPRERVVGVRLRGESELGALMQEVARLREPVILNDLGGVSLLARDLTAAGVPIPSELLGRDRAELAVPLIFKGKVTGVQTLIHEQPSYYTERHARLAMAFAQQAAAAIENARLYEAARERAALEERQRLARELHDSVSQVLYAIALNASAAEEVIEEDPARVGDLLRDVLSLAEAGLAEMRALIFELRPESLEREGLVPALERQAAAVEARHGIAVRLDLGEEPEAPLAVKEALYRIAQEALQNVARHARGRAAAVALEAGPGEVVLRVSDDGRGFDPGGEFPGHLGLRSMRERAAALGGVLELESAPGRGTRLCARVPVPAPAGDAVEA